MPDPRLAAARVRARFTASWLAGYAGDAPTMVRKFLYEDVPHVLDAADRPMADPGREPITSTEFLDQHIDPLLDDLVPLAGAMAAAAAAGNDVLYQAREADVAELIDGICVHKLRALAIVLAHQLHDARSRAGRPFAGRGPGHTPVLEWKDAAS